MAMDELKSLFLGVQFKDKDQVFNILQEEGIDDMETLKESREEDLPSAGLKMGDIIKIRRVLANKSVALNSSLSSTSTSESEFEIGNNEAKCSSPIHLTVKEQGVNVQPSFASLEVTCSYSPQDLLSKCVPGTKCTKEQLAKTDPAPASFVKAHDGGSIGVGQWVAVAYDNKYYIGKVTAIERPVLDDEDEISINYLARGQNGKYKWPKKKIQM